MPSGTSGDTTKSTDVRWEYTSTITSILLVLSLPVILIGVAVGQLSIDGISQSWFLLYMAAVLAAVVYIFGEETLAAVKKFRK